MREALRFIKHAPEIERRMRGCDTIVCGMGPTAWLLPWLDQGAVRNCRIWGAHDFARIYQPDDLLLLDDTSQGLSEMAARYEGVLAARPRRLWVYEPQVDFWRRRLDPAVLPLIRPQQFDVQWPRPDGEPPQVRWDLAASPPMTSMISPIAMTTLAWSQGCRKIGVLGVDLLSGTHPTSNNAATFDQWFCQLADLAREAGGSIVNLSPITSMALFEGLSA